jgi:hypothetical protein
MLPSGAVYRRSRTPRCSAVHRGVRRGTTAENIFSVEDNYAYSVRILRTKRSLHNDGVARHERPAVSGRTTRQSSLSATQGIATRARRRPPGISECRAGVGGCALVRCAEVRRPVGRRRPGLCRWSRWCQCAGRSGAASWRRAPAGAAVQAQRPAAARAPIPCPWVPRACRWTCRDLVNETAGSWTQKRPLVLPP